VLAVLSDVNVGFLLKAWDGCAGYELGNPGFITTLYVNA
jgi:hypothetical protein